MKLFELRACWEEYYDDPDNGMTKVCDVRETIRYSVDDDAPLQALLEDLAAGFDCGHWSERRARHLRRIYPGYNDFRDTKYEIADVSSLILEPPGSEERK